MSRLAVEPGLYRHFKGGLYRVLSAAKDSESDEIMVVYRAAFSGGETWVRPLSMFTEMVWVDGALKPRFERVSDFAMRQNYELKRA